MVWLILLVAGVLRTISLNQSFWLDEAAQAVLSSKPIFSVNYAADFQPPLFYVFSHYWMNLGALLGTQSEWFLRLPSVIFGVVTVYLAYRFFGEVFNKKIGLISALLLATAPFHIYYSQEFRMYSLLTLLGLISWMLLWKKRCGLYSIFVCLLVFTHYFAFVLILSQAIFVFLYQREKLKCYITATALGLAPFVLWLPTFLKQLETSGQLMQAWPEWSALSNIAFLKFPGLVLAKFTVGMISPDNKILYGVSAGIIGVIFLLSLTKVVSRKLLKNKPLILLLIYFLVPLFIAWIAGLFISASTPWRIQFVLPAFYALIAVGVEKWNTKQTKYVYYGMLGLILALNLYFTSQYLFNSQHHRENWRDAITYTDSLAKTNAIVLTEFIGPWAPIEWYSNHPEKYHGSSTEQRITPQSVQNKLNPLISTIKPEHAVLYTYLFEISDPNQQVEQYLLQERYHLSEEKDFRGVGIIKTYSR